MLNQQALQHSLQRHKGWRTPGRRWMAQASTALVLQLRDQQPHMLLIQRAQRQGDPWSGHMALPGGRKDRQDPNGLATAIRETAEEVGLQLNDHYCVGNLSDRVTRRHERLLPMVISPYVFWLDDDSSLQLASSEVTRSWWVPVEFFRSQANRQRMRWQFARINWSLPCYHYQNQTIWGLTLMMIDEFMRATHAP